MIFGERFGKISMRNIYFFLRVKNDFRFDSSLADEAGNVIERLSPLAALWHCAFRAPTHWFISASSCACSRNSAPVDSLGKVRGITVRVRWSGSMERIRYWTLTLIAERASSWCNRWPHRRTHSPAAAAARYGMSPRAPPWRPSGLCRTTNGQHGLPHRPNNGRTNRNYCRTHNWTSHCLYNPPYPTIGSLPSWWCSPIRVCASGCLQPHRNRSRVSIGLQHSNVRI